MDMVFGILGVAGGLLCACADLLLDLKGKDNHTLGQDGVIDSAVEHMDARRFPGSIRLAAVAVPLIFLGMTALAHQLWLADHTLALVFWIAGAAGSTGSLFIHSVCCIWPIIYKTMKPYHSLEEIDRVIHALFRAILPPFVVLYALYTLVPSVVIWVALARGCLALPWWFGLLTPPVMMAAGAVLKLLNGRVFCDLPSVVMPSLGMGMMGLMAILNPML